MEAAKRHDDHLDDRLLLRCNWVMMHLYLVPDYALTSDRSRTVSDLGEAYE